jgi:disulfide bond formation protein DsbB
MINLLKEPLVHLYRLPLHRPRLSLLVMALLPVLLLIVGLYLQHVVGLEPCPMCIVQRYLMCLIALVGALGASRKAWLSHLVSWAALLLLSISGAYVAARQSWLQWYPPEVVSCGRDFYGMIETFPLKRAIPMIFKGGGDCSNVDWTFLGGSIANWSFVAFVGFALASLIALALMLAARKSDALKS